MSGAASKGVVPLVEASRYGAPLWMSLEAAAVPIRRFLFADVLADLP